MCLGMIASFLGARGDSWQARGRGCVLKRGLAYYTFFAFDIDNNVSNVFKLEPTKTFPDIVKSCKSYNLANNI